MDPNATVLGEHEMLKRIWPYIEATRWKINLFTVLLTLVTFKYVGIDLADAVLPATTVFLIACTTMVQNDLRDRVHDLGKGKSHAYDHSREYRILASIMWQASAVLAIALYLRYGPIPGMIALSWIVVGLSYSELLLVPALPNLLVAIAPGFVVLLSANISGAQRDWHVWVLLAVVVSTIHGREILKDFEDEEADSGHKWTWPIRFGNTVARRMAAWSFAVSTIAMLSLYPLSASRWLYGLPVPWITAILYCSRGDKLTPKEVKFTKTLGDLQMVVVIVYLFFASRGAP